MDIINERIRQRKEDLKLTYDRMADLLFVSRGTVQLWGSGKTIPTTDRIPDICRILQCTPNYLFGFSDMPSAVIRTQMSSADCISRQDAIDAFRKELCVEETESGRNYIIGFLGIERVLNDLPPAQPVQRWIPFETRPLTEEEKEEHPEWDCILDCKLPDDGQRILVTIRIRGHEEVQQDEFYSDDGSYLDSGYEIGTEAVAWMPLPEPYRRGGENE